ncbi:MAG: DNA mismatch repair protein MutS [Desulfobacterales bacterium]
MNPTKLTPMLKQYLSIKDDYPDAILLYRMGDFYEMFFEDAERASRVLEITLTSRNKNDDEPIPMCGVPYRAVQGYISRLIENGHKVAICDQVEDPAKAKGIVKRAVVRVITPGMIVENEFLEAKIHNYILAVNVQGDRWGLSYLDISTGTFRLTESGSEAAVYDEALRVDPREILLPDEHRSLPLVRKLAEVFAEKAVSFLDEGAFDSGKCRDRLLGLLGTVSLAGFGCEELRAGVSAAGALVHYLQETQKQKIEHITGIETYLLSNYLWVDDRSCQNLELLANLQSGSRKGSLLSVIDKTATAMGGRLLRQWLRYPLMDPVEIRSRQDAVAEALEERTARLNLGEILKSVYDLDRLRSKIAMGHANARDLVALKCTIQMLPEVLSITVGWTSPLLRLDTGIDDLLGLAETLEAAIREDAPPTINEGGMIKPGFDAGLDELIHVSRDGKGWLAELEAREKAATGIAALKVRYNKVFGYYIEVPKSRSSEVPGRYVRKQTLVNAERYITDELKNFENKVLNAEERRSTLEYEIFVDLRRRVMDHHPRIQQVAGYLARIDCLLGLAEVAERDRYCRPGINVEGVIELEDARHPVIEKQVTGERFVPNSIRMDNEREQVLIITGPNMAGKSTVLRQVALIVVLAQMGSFVPAVRANVALTDRIFTRVGALDNLSQGQSTFLVEMQETANILHHATGDSLVVLDEIGRGTSTFDGLSIAWAVAEHLHDLRGRGVKTLFATHYHELTDLSETLPRVKNYNIAVKEWNDEVIFLRKLVEGGTNRSYGIQVARLAGIPITVIDRARSILAGIENGEQPNRARRSGAGRGASRQVQLGLFRSSENEVVDELKKADINRMTPMDAINLLSRLADKARLL